MPPQEIEMKQKGDKIKVSLHYDIVKYVGPSYTTTIKAFNGVAPAPTIRVKPGYELEVKFYNDLEFETGTDGHNSFRLPNTTK